MDENARLNPIVFLCSFVVLLLVATGIITPLVPLESARPLGSGIPASSVPDRAPARLWQDPLEVLPRSEPFRLLDSVGAWLGSRTSRLRPTLALVLANRDDNLDENRRPGKAGIIMPVFLPGRNYPEDRERRIRTRYAILSGLSRENYTPRLADDISFFKWQNDHLRIDLLVPFELFERREPDKGNTEWVIVLWLDESEFMQPRSLDSGLQAVEPQPLRLFYELVQEIRAVVRDCRIRGIGPNSSTTLARMIEEDRFQSSDTKDKRDSTAPDRMVEERQLQGTASESFTARDREAKESQLTTPRNVHFEDVELYSPWTTVPFALLGVHVDGEAPFKNTSLEFDRYGTDDSLASVLLRELELRNTRLFSRKDHVVLIAEWDTLYGRTLPTSFKHALGRETARRRKGRFSAETCDEAVKNVHSFTYLRGLDGGIEGRTRERDELQERKDFARESSALEFAESPVGNSQLDYLRRLVDRIWDLDRHIRRSGRGKVTAIGILGSDVYDKLLLLRALRTRFATATFFTTHLDAQFTHPKQNEYTKNVVVASHFGFRLKHELQGPVAPFRSGYQTATFFACLTLLECLNPFSTDSGEDSRRYLRNIPAETPRIFEIARNGAFDLSPESSTVIHPPTTRGRVWLLEGSRWRFCALLIVVAIPFLLLLNRGFRGAVSNWLRRDLVFPGRTNARENVGTQNENAKVWVTFSLVSLGIVALSFGLMVFDSMRDNGEPFALWQGISVYGTDIIRLLTAILTVYFLLTIRESLKQNRVQIEQEYFEKKELERAEKKLESDLKEGVRGPFLKRHLYRCFPWLLDGHGEKSLEEAWFTYHHESDANRCIPRILPFIVVVVFVFYMVHNLFDSYACPTRGKLCAYIDEMIYLFLATVGFGLVVVVMDLALNCQRFIQQLVPAEGGSRVARTSAKRREDSKNELKRLRLIADRTRVVEVFLYYPFIILSLVLACRLRYFDNWNWPPTVLTIVFGVVITATVIMFVLRRTAYRARERVLGNLQSRILEAVNNSREISLLEQISLQVRSLRKGSFCPLRETPAIRAMLIPFGGFGGIAIIEFVAQHL